MHVCRVPDPRLSDGYSIPAYLRELGATARGIVTLGQALEGSTRLRQVRFA